jgi:signal transduction histidine kinase
MGLNNLRGRVESLGGSFAVASVLGEGTTVRIELPL